jgi:hypothetical protein
VFGIGSMMGMTIMSVLISLPARLLRAHWPVHQYQNAVLNGLSW